MVLRGKESSAKEDIGTYYVSDLSRKKRHLQDNSTSQPLCRDRWDSEVFRPPTIAMVTLIQMSSSLSSSVTSENGITSKASSSSLGGREEGGREGGREGEREGEREGGRRGERD